MFFQVLEIQTMRFMDHRILVGNLLQSHGVGEPLKREKEHVFYRAGWVPGNRLPSRC